MQNQILSAVAAAAERVFRVMLAVKASVSGGDPPSGDDPSRLVIAEAKLPIGRDRILRLTMNRDAAERACGLMTGGILRMGDDDLQHAASELAESIAGETAARLRQVGSAGLGRDFVPVLSRDHPLDAAAVSLSSEVGGILIEVVEPKGVLP